MKVIGINGSSRKDGNTAIIIRTIFEELNKRGIETEFIQLADVDIEPCRACFACKGKGNCVLSSCSCYLSLRLSSHRSVAAWCCV